MRTVLVAVLATLASAASASAEPYVVVYKPTVPSVDVETDQLQTAYAFTSRSRWSTALRGFSADLSSTQRDKVSRDPDVEFVTKDVTFTGLGATLPVAAGELVPPGIRRIGGVASGLAHGAAGSAVAVLDTGADLANPDLNVVSGTNCIKPGTPAADDNGHGTHVAGILAARNTGAGVAGVAPDTKLYAVKVLNNKSTGTLSQLICGINWVAANAGALGIRTANLSYGGSGANDNACGAINKDAQHKAVCEATAQGVTFVAGAGNSGKGFAATVPAAYPEVLTATAMTDTDGLPGAKGLPPACRKSEKDDVYGTYSNFATTVAEAAHTIAAPGTCVQSDKMGGGTAIYYGTSQAAPHVAAAVALCMDGPCAGLAPADVINRVRADATADAFLGKTGRVYGPLTRADVY